MLKLLKIENFQSHNKTQLSFHEGVNVIVGSSDCGKTAIIRALRWVIWNRPSGDHIRSVWGGDTSVTIGTEDATIVRSKSKQDTYHLRDKDRDLDFRAIGTNVPEEVQKLLNITEINLQGQLDSPFLISDTPGAVAAHFNKVARLDKIDSSIQSVNSAIRKLDADIEYTEKDIANQEGLLTGYAHLEDLEKDVEALEAMEKDLVAKNTDVDQFRRLVKQIVEVKLDIEDVTLPLGYEEAVEKVYGYYSVIKEKTASLQALRRIVMSVRDIKAQVEGYTLIMEAAPLTDQLIGLFSSARQQKLDVANLIRLKDKLHAVKREFLKSQEKGLKLEKRFHEEMPDVCPLCEQPINKK